MLKLQLGNYLSKNLFDTHCFSGSVLGVFINRMFEHSCYKYKEKYWKTDHHMCISQVKENNEMGKLKQFYNSKKGT